MIDRRSFTAALFAFALLGFAGGESFAADRSLTPFKAENLNGVEMDLPAQFSAEKTAITFSFSQEQAKDGDAWQALIEGKEADRAKLAFYHVALINRPGGMIRGFIRSGMRSIYKDEAQRAKVIILFTEREPYMKAMDFTQDKAVVTLLFDKSGKELARAEGPATPEALAGLFAAAN
jgi:hypothetical protein